MLFVQILSTLFFSSPKMLSQPPPFSPKMEGPLLALELRAQTLAENGNEKAQMDG